MEEFVLDFQALGSSSHVKETYTTTMTDLGAGSIAGIFTTFWGCAEPLAFPGIYWRILGRQRTDSVAS